MMKDISLSCIQSVLEEIDTPRSLAVYLLFNYNEHDQLISLEIDPSQYFSPDTFRHDYLATKLLSKYPHLELSVDPLEEALKSFRLAENSCKETNHRFFRWRNNRLSAGREINSILHAASRLAYCILGDIDTTDLLASCGWGPGVTSSCKGSNVSLYNKVASNIHYTATMKTVGFHRIIDEFPQWSKEFLSQGAGDTPPSGPFSVLLPDDLVVPGNTVTFVPKNAKTHRPIAIEPHLNMFVQKGFGSLIRNKLRDHGLNLNTQVNNINLAKQGSINGRYATVDLSSASDTIAIELVREILPPTWFKALDACRSHRGTYRGDTFVWEKFSSMGNGFTFELESLLFYCIARATMDYHSHKGKLLVFGDDIILPTQSFDPLVRVLTFCGFGLNEAKSFSTGPFRESCGGDFYNGVPVRPFFIKDKIMTLQSYYKIANAICRFSANGSWGMDPRLFKTWRLVFTSCPKNKRLRIPASLGDVGFISTKEEALSSHSPPEYIRGPGAIGKASSTYGLKVKTYRFFSRKGKVSRLHSAIHASIVRQMRSEILYRFNRYYILDQDRCLFTEKIALPTLGRYDLRSIGIWKVSSSVVRQWDDFGFWLR